MKPFISIIVPIYNLEKYIYRCIESILKQSYMNYEVICVDDCSSDSSVMIVKELTKLDNRVRLICNEKNLGPSITRYNGILASKGDYLFFLDGDDTISEDALFVLCKTASISTADIIKGQIDVVTLDGKYRPLNQDTLPYGGSIYGVYRALLEGKLRHNLAATLFSRDLVLNNHYNVVEGMRNGEDGYFFYQMVANIRYGIIVIPDVIYYYHMHTTSSTHIKLSDKAIRGLVIFYDYVSKIEYKDQYLSQLALRYCTYNLNEFALLVNNVILNRQIEFIGAYSFLSTKYRLRYMTLRQLSSWYIRFIISKFRCLYEKN